MAVINLVTANTVRVVESWQQVTGVVDETVDAGAPARLATADGRITNSNGSSAAEGRTLGLAARRATSGALTIIKKGIMDGWDLDALAYDAPVYVSNTDGRLDTVAGTVSVIVGRVIGVKAGVQGSALQKMLLIDL